MIEQICAFIHNYFEREVYRGSFKISGGIVEGLELMLRLFPNAEGIVAIEGRRIQFLDLERLQRISDKG